MRKTMITTVAAASLLLVAACGGDDFDSGLSDDDRTSTTTASETDDSTTTTGPDGPGGSSGPDDDAGNNEVCEGQTPVWAFAPTERAPARRSPASKSSARAELVAHTPASEARQSQQECAQPEPELGTGDVQITLRWESTSDLDLHVTEPNGTEIWYSETGPTSTGGRLDVDSNVGCDDDGSVENVYWPTGRMPTGEFTVEVNGFRVDGCGGGRYTVTGQVEGEEVLNETGEVGEDETDTYHFTVE